MQLSSVAGVIKEMAFEFTSALAGGTGALYASIHCCILAFGSAMVISKPNPGIENRSVECGAIVCSG